MTTIPAIETVDLTKTFHRGGQRTVAVDRLNLTIKPGALVAFLGPNGAGKSTTLRMLTTLLTPTSGRALLHGLDVARDPAGARRRFGFVGQGNGAGSLQHGRDEVIGQAMAHGASRRAATLRADEVIEALDLGELARRPVQQLSGGQRRRFDIAIGLVHRPELLFLDEPSTGLDPQSRAHLQELIRDLHRQTGSTIVLTTHYLEEADALSERVVVIDHGRIIADASSRELKTALGDLVQVHLSSPQAASYAASTLTRNGTAADCDGHTIRVRTNDGPRAALAMLDRLRDSGHPVTGLEVARPSLDDVFLDLTGRALRDAGPVPDETETQPRPTPQEVSA
ncbi:ATP-binding cassette domain-containing protein [Blastococcus sp. Marseille-P5729]|uniref:ATP-binding cassette domain-containing protein n=1 Tax=Blastococcus sp. Marseille-P5729 TaxID=2086582 RepID=UPI000D10859D|nr:ATP-binding cassette domain-containing protein [Blastococcus sp. Marseille-P5729]